VQNGLKERGYDVTRLNTYDTVSAKWSAAEEEAAKAAGIVTLASPSAVKTWAKRVGVSQVISPLHSFRGLHGIRLLTSHPRTGGGLHWGDECSGLQGGRL
jgi:uroporphyrinogen-III synthase